VGERVQGRVFFRGPSRTSGYFRNPKATAAIMTEDGWMDSGDLAYWADGEIFVTGRLKDCIIKSGRNIIPQEVEAATAEVTGVRRGCVAAFGTVDEATGTERLVVAAETRTTRADELGRIETEIIEKIDSILGIPPDQVILVRPQAIPKTSSGKIRRNETRTLYLSGKLNASIRPPWVQLVRLWFEQVGSWLRLTVEQTGSRVRRAYNSMLMVTAAGLAGSLARLTPGRRVAAGFVQSGARFLLSFSGREISLNGGDRFADGKPCVIVTNRAGIFDPLVLAATMPSHFLVSDPTAFRLLPDAVKFLLKPLLIRDVNGNAQPPGGTLGEKMGRALQGGHSVVVFPDCAVGAPAHQCRFHLEVLRAATSLGCNIVPVALAGTEEMFTRQRRGGSTSACVNVGEPIHQASAGQDELIKLRERLREEIGKLCA